MSDVYVLDAVRTPIGRYGGGAGRRAARRPGRARAGARWSARSPAARPGRASTTSCSATPTAPARTTATWPGWPCCSPGCRPRARRDRQPAVRLGPGGRRSRRLARDRGRRRRRSCVAGGVESMSRAPWVLPKPAQGLPAPATRRCTPPRWAGAWSTRGCPSEWTISLGESAEMLADRYAISREEQDAFALRSHQRAAEAWDDGVYDRRGRARCPAPTSTATRASAPDTSMETLARLKPVFRTDGTVTAGNASPLNDGAAALLLGDEAAGAEAAGPRAAGAHRRRARRRRRPATCSASARSRRPTEALAPRRHRLGRPRRRRAQRGVRRRSRWPAWPSGPTSTPRSSTSSGGAIAIGHPLGARARASSAAWPHELHRRGGGLRPGRDLHRRRPGPGRRPARPEEADDERQLTPAASYVRVATRRAPAAGLRRTTSRRALRHPTQPLIYLPQRLTEMTGPLLGESRRRPARPRPDPPARRRAARPADHRPRAGARQRRAAGAATRWSRSGRPTPAGATGTPVDNWPAPLDPNFTGVGPRADRRRGPLPVHHRSSPAPTRGATTTTPGARRTSTSRCSAGRSPSGWSPRCTSRATRCSSRTRSSTRCATSGPRADDLALRPRRHTEPDVGAGLRVRHRAARAATRPRSRRRTTMSELLGLTPSQTVGPYLHIGLPWDDGPYVVPEGTPGAVRIGGRVFDGDGAPVPDAMVETWQADPDGRFDHPDDPRGAAPPAVAGFRGFGRCARPSTRGAGRIAHRQARAACPTRRRRDAGAAPRRLRVRPRAARPGRDPDLLRRRGGGQRGRPGAGRGRPGAARHARRGADRTAATASTSTCRGSVRPSSSPSERPVRRPRLFGRLATARPRRCDEAVGDARRWLRGDARGRGRAGRGRGRARARAGRGGRGDRRASPRRAALRPRRARAAAARPPATRWSPLVARARARALPESSRGAGCTTAPPARTSSTPR